MANKDDSNARKAAAFIFNIYNEHLINKFDAEAFFLTEDKLPDYHVVFAKRPEAGFARRAAGAIFVPLLIPEAAGGREIAEAQIVGWRTVDPELLDRLEANFSHYRSIATRRKREQAFADLESEMTALSEKGNQFLGA